MIGRPYQNTVSLSFVSIRKSLYRTHNTRSSHSSSSFVQQFSHHWSILIQQEFSLNTDDPRAFLCLFRRLRDRSLLRAGQHSHHLKTDTQIECRFAILPPALSCSSEQIFLDSETRKVFSFRFFVSFTVDPQLRRPPVHSFFSNHTTLACALSLHIK
jgi:hypothetical protein